MAQELFEGSGILNPEAISKEEDLIQKCFPLWDGPRCEVCGRHISELKPFGGPGDPLDGDFSGELLVRRYRPMGPYDEAAEKAWQEAEKSVPGQEDIMPWLISKYGEKEAHDFFFSYEAYRTTVPRRECRDCARLSEDEYFEAIGKRWKENRSKWMVALHFLAKITMSPDQC